MTTPADMYIAGIRAGISEDGAAALADLIRRARAEAFQEAVNFIDDQPGPWGAAIVAGREEAARRMKNSEPTVS